MSEVKTAPFAIEDFLKGINFPCSKDDLIAHARRNKAPQDILGTMGKLPARDYSSPADVAKAYGEISH